MDIYSLSRLVDTARDFVNAVASLAQAHHEVAKSINKVADEVRDLKKEMLKK